MKQVPLVDYLVLDPKPKLLANECRKCGERFLDRRTACASCFEEEFIKVELPADGEIHTFSIVHVAAPGVDVPFVPAVVRIDGTLIPANIINTPPDPDHIVLNMAVSLTTYSLGTDANGVEAIAFAFEPTSRSAL